MKILVAVPTFENIYPDTYKAIYGLNRDGHEVVFNFVRGYDCATARNRIAQESLDEGVDYVLMVDNDVVIPPDALINLTDDLKEVCLGFYAHRDTDNIYRGRTCVCKLFCHNVDHDTYHRGHMSDLYMAHSLRRYNISSDYILYLPTLRLLLSYIF